MRVVPMPLVLVVCEAFALRALPVGSQEIRAGEASKG